MIATTMVAGLDRGSTDPRAPLAIDAAIASGSTIGGRYRVRRQIGSGGMGSVWCVHDVRTGEDVALKVLSPRAGEESLARFRREVALARRIAHPNVCRVFDLGDPEGLQVLTMELVEGESLRARLARGRLPWAEARRLIDDILAGLTAVHAAGVVHRDVKPENIVIAADGRAVLVDFGLAWAPATEPTTSPEVGTPQYMAPEQLAGEAVEPRSDVFAAGMVIQEILDGRPPFEGATVALVSSAILRDLPRPLEGREVPVMMRAGVARLVARALGRDRRSRQANGGELQREWRAATADAGGPRRRWRRRAAIAATVTAAGSSATVVAYTVAARGHPGDSAAELSSAIARPGEPRWVRSLSSMTPYGIAEGPGGVVVTGGVVAPADLGGGLIMPAGLFDAVIASFSSDGAHLYSVRHGGAGSEFPFLDAVAANGAPIVHGVSYGEVDLGNGPVRGGGSGRDGFLGVYGPTGPLWVQRIVGPGEDQIVATAPGPNSAVYAAGSFEGVVNLDGGTLTSSGGRDVFLGRFNVFTGAVELTRQYGGGGRDEVSGLASTGSHIIMAGMFEGTLVLGGAASPVTSAGELDVFVAKLGLDGTPVWAVRFGGAAGEDRDPRVTADAAGDIYVTGRFRGRVAFGAVDLISRGGADVFVAKLRGGDGSVVWALGFGGAGDDFAGKIAIDPAGRVAVASTISGPLDGRPATAGLDALLTVLDGSSGSLRWRRIYSTAGDDRLGAVTFGRDGDLYAGVSLAGAFDFGRPVLGAPNPGAVLLRIAP